ncbi:MAG TPA: hypothetical protein VN950_18700 [Terriglobales bacterium]|nr:hypothetical protein [Terriglobales bacterium]
MRSQNPARNAGAPRELTVTADPNTPQAIPPTSLGSKLPSAERSDASATAVETPPTHPEGRRYVSLELWLHRITVLTFGLVCAVVGVLLVILPWRPEWTDNRLLMAYPELRAFVANGFVRGVCSGLGILDIWIGFSEAIHYHEEKRP